jgi:hypothetical protein
MPVSLFLAVLWVLVACGAHVASPRVGWPASWVLIVTGIPLLGLVTLQLGPVVGLCGLVLGVILIRRPREEELGPLGGDP